VNKYWSFQSPQHKRALGEAWRFLVLFLASYALSLTLFSALTWSGIRPYLAKLATDTICFFFNFLVMRWWVYRHGARAAACCAGESAVKSSSVMDDHTSRS
jgi:putative flippase GtrA